MKRLPSENERKTSLIESEIFYAIQHSQYKQLALYLRHNYDINITSKDGRNGLFYALDIDNPSKRCRMIKYCLNHGINPFRKENINGYTVLHETIARQQIDSFQLILPEVSGEINWRSLDKHGRTILHQAVETNNIKILEDLITIMNHYNISVDLIDRNGLTPYLLAKKLHLPDMAQILLIKGHASRQKCDSQTHLSAHEWETIGYKERNLILRQKLRQEMNDAMLNGKITKVNKLKTIYYPTSSLSNIEDQRRNSYLTMITRSGLNTKSPLSIAQSSEYDKREFYINSRTDKQHLPPITTTIPSHHANSLIDLFQIVELSS
jgi:ankyrin repeat protein